MMKKYLSIYAAATILVFGALLPLHFYYERSLNNDSKAYDSDSKLQDSYNLWLSNYLSHIRSWNGLIKQNDSSKYSWETVDPSPPSPSTNWKKNDQAKIDSDNKMILIDECSFYAFVLLSLAYWIMIWGFAKLAIAKLQ